MDRDKFIDGLKTASAELNKEYYDKMITNVISHNSSNEMLGVNTNDVVAMEELAELQEEISRKLRGREKSNIGVLEEMADVIISISILQRIFNISDSDLNKAVNVKLDRFADKIKNIE